MRYTACSQTEDLEFESGPAPLSYCILGGLQLYSRDNYIVSLVKAPQVKDAAAALRPVSKEWFRGRYFQLADTDYEGEVGEQDFEYAWCTFEDLPGFFDRAAKANRAIVFTADQ